MKALPFVTLALCVGFLIFQRTSVASLTRSNTSLQSRITQAEASPVTSPEPGSAPSAATKGGRRNAGAAAKKPTLATAQSLEELDLDELAETMQKAESGGVPDFKAIIRLRSLLLEATPEEISDLIARTGELEIPSQIKEGLIGQFLEVLAEHDPRGALEARLQSPDFNLSKQRWQLSHNFSKWLNKEPAAALAWFDRELAKGTFESKSLSGESEVRREFEAAAIGSLTRSDSARARERLLALPEDQRTRILSESHRFDLTGENAASYAQLIRSSLPEEAQAEVLAGAAQNVAQRGGYKAVTEFADQVNASEAERSSIVRQAALRQFERMNWEDRTPKAEDVTELRSFLQAEAPESANQITGEALARSTNSTQNFDAAVGLLRDLHASNPDDQLLVGFLESPGVRARHQEGARELAQEINDPAQRTAILENLK